MNSWKNIYNEQLCSIMLYKDRNFYQYEWSDGEGSQMVVCKYSTSGDKISTTPVNNDETVKPWLIMGSNGSCFFGFGYDTNNDSNYYIIESTDGVSWSKNTTLADEYKAFLTYNNFVFCQDELFIPMIKTPTSEDEREYTVKHAFILHRKSGENGEYDMIELSFDNVDSTEYLPDNEAVIYDRRIHLRYPFRVCIHGKTTIIIMSNIGIFVNTDNTNGNNFQQVCKLRNICNTGYNICLGVEYISDKYVSIMAKYDKLQVAKTTIMTSLDGIVWTETEFNYYAYNKRPIQIFKYDEQLYLLESQILDGDWNWNFSNSSDINLEELIGKTIRYVIRKINVNEKQITTFNELKDCIVSEIMRNLGML